MNKSIFYPIILILTIGLFSACEDFVNPDQELVLNEEGVPSDKVELRSLCLGMYALQQDLVEQIVVLGELRGDLIEATRNADPDLREVYEFNISENNRYASPSNFYKLIGASNKVIRILEEKYPEVKDTASDISNNHKMYGEAICMRSWAYFNAARIYGKIPYIPEDKVTISEIEAFVASSETFSDTVHISYAANGLDPLVNEPVEISNKEIDQDIIIKKCIKQIEDKVVVVGVDYGAREEYSNIEEWKSIVWNKYAKAVLLGQMYLHIGDYTKAMANFNVILKYSDPDAQSNVLRFGMDDYFEEGRWKNIFSSINENEHIFSVFFDKHAYSHQRNNLQYYFSAVAPNQYALKPTKDAVELWESIWRGKVISSSNIPEEVFTRNPGTPGDFHRGHGVSYRYLRNERELSKSDVEYMLKLKLKGNITEMNEYMEGIDTVVYKYSFGKGRFDHDAYFHMYRAASIHLYAAEIYANWKYIDPGKGITSFPIKGEQYIYNGDYQSDIRQLGVAGRVGFGDNTGIGIDRDYVYEFDGYTNEIIGDPIYIADDVIKTEYLEKVVLKEKARELAFEGERYYDIMRIARRRNREGRDGSKFMAEMISEKFHSPAERERVYNYLMNESNWYLPIK